jgi:hypothetical protein
MEILPFSLIALSIFYAIVAIVAVLRFFKVLRSKSAIKISTAFYITMFIAAVARAVSLVLIAINMEPDQEKESYFLIFIYLMIIVPDMTNVCLYVFLVWYYYANFMLSHVNIANDLSIFMQNGIYKFNAKMSRQFHEKHINSFLSSLLFI